MKHIILAVAVLFLLFISIMSCIGVKSGTITGRVTEVIPADDRGILVKFDDGRVAFCRYSMAPVEYAVIEIGKVNRIHYLGGYGISKVEILNESAESNR